MCHSCAAEYMGVDMDEGVTVEAWAAIEWEPMTDDMRLLVQLVTELYELPNCSTGGPLHIVVDDFNIEDESLDFCERDLTDPYYNAKVQAASARIIALMRPMSLRQRATALATEWRLLP